MQRVPVDLHTPEPIPPTHDPDPQPGDRKPKAPPAEDERGPQAPIELPGQPHAPERVH
ncbi:hypothetical protein [Ramlibacter tataouinensis]|uniref:Uncharacterized protein n=1 Tax=Ramlibacter tataouinensis (strain ATCC BAA-407 / DSM 14655 / LMG 21543 / TTB310) TaxID=365046 RepID=F5Y0R2_RAMTT|nr:hypothetical protein [Ramlibacter tataouinensis]AEG94656.1 Hypothetical protein Rta_35430 [Ramlibacter tataouinensis TTB310]